MTSPSLLRSSTILSLSTLIETNYIKRLLKDNKKTPQDIKMSAPNSNNNQASMIGGHAQYAKGYVEESVRLTLFYIPVQVFPA
jgi:hypothetical protein